MLIFSRPSLNVMLGRTALGTDLRIATATSEGLTLPGLILTYAVGHPRDGFWLSATLIPVEIAPTLFFLADTGIADSNDAETSMLVISFFIRTTLLVIAQSF